MKILSISDVITNSSSEVFVMNSSDIYDDWDVDEINWDFILSSDEQRCILYLLDIPCSDVLPFKESQYGYDYNKEGKRGFYKYLDEKDWEKFCNAHKEEIEEKIINEDLVFVSISDDYEGCEEDLICARSNHVWSENRH